MILVDTSIWVRHLRSGNANLVSLLNAAHVLVHPMVVGELACGSLKNRSEIIDLLQSLPASHYASDSEVMHLIESRSLMSRGIGYIDMHLLASVILGGSLLWSADNKLTDAALDLGVAYPTP